MEAEMQSYAGEGLRDAYFSINNEYVIAHSDVCRPWILYKYGEMWLDLRGTPSQDSDDIGVETAPRFFNALVPLLLFEYSGQQKSELNVNDNKYEEIMNGFMMSSDHQPVWLDFSSLQVTMQRSYPQRWQLEVQRTRKNKLQTFEKAPTFFSKPLCMMGREGVLCMRPLAMTKIVYKYLSEAIALNTCVPRGFHVFWYWSSQKTRNKSYEKRQAKLLYWEPKRQAAHTHYSNKTTPIVHVAKRQIAR